MSITVSPLQRQGNPSQRRAFRQSRPSPSPVVRRFFPTLPPFQPCLSQICHKSRIQSRLLPQYQPAGKFVQFSLSRIYLESQTVPQKSHHSWDTHVLTMAQYQPSATTLLQAFLPAPSCCVAVLRLPGVACEPPEQSRSEMTKPYQAYIYTTRATTV